MTIRDVDELMPNVYVDREFRHHQAWCGCGWTGRPRRLLALAKQDAWLHAAHTEHWPARPLVLPPHDDWTTP